MTAIDHVAHLIRIPSEYPEALITFAVIDLTVCLYNWKLVRVLNTSHQEYRAGEAGDTMLQ